MAKETKPRGKQTLTMENGSPRPDSTESEADDGEQSDEE